MKLNKQTARFLAIYEPLIAQEGFTSERDFCKEVLKWSNATFSQAKNRKRNIPNVVLYRFITYFKLKPSLIFGDSPGTSKTALIHLQKNHLIQFHDGTIKRIISRTDAEGFTFLILK